MSASIQRRSALVGLALVGLLSAFSIAAAEAHWPSVTRIEHDNRHSSLLVFIHPRCQCSRSIVDQVLSVTETAEVPIRATFVFYCPDGEPDEWVQNESWSRLNDAGKYTLLVDRGGIEAERFNASSSGHCLLFDINRRLLFSGGLAAGKDGMPSPPALDALGTHLSGRREAVSAFPVVGCDLQEQSFLSEYDFFTNYGNYMPRIHCLQTAEGRPDWAWIVTLIVLNITVLVGYTKIMRTWRACYLAEEERDRDPKLMDLAWIFFFCGISGYGISTVIFFWPAYRLLALFLLLLAIVTWRFAYDLKPFEESFSAKRVGRQTRESLEEEIAESVARESESREAYRVSQAILDSLPSHVCILNTRGEVILTNARWNRFAVNNGGDEAYLLANYLDICRSATGECRSNALALAEAIERIISEGSGSYTAEYACHSEHQQRWFEVCVMPVEKHLEGATIVTHTDITSRVLAEKEAQAQREEAERLALVAKYTDNAVVITDHEVRIEWVNDGFTRLTGFTLDEVRGKVPGEVLQGVNTDQSTVEFMTERISRKQGFDVEIVNYSKAGKEYWLAMEVRPIEDANRNVNKYIAIESDITDRKRREQELADLNRELSEQNKAICAERRLLTTIIDSLPQAIFWKDQSSTYVGCNSVFAELVGMRSPADIAGRTDFDLAWSQDDALQYAANDREVIAGEQVMVNVEQTQSLSCGTQKTIWTSKTPLFDEHGAIVGLVGAFTDITNQKQIERRLAQAEKLESIGRLASGVAHEINTPMQFIGCNVSYLSRIVEQWTGLQTAVSVLLNGEGSGGLERLRETLPSEDILRSSEEALADCRLGVERVSEIIGAMKEFAHPGSDDSMPFDINRSIQNAATLTKNATKQHAVVELDLAECGLVQGSASSMSQALVNLIVNAADAIEEASDGGIVPGHITISTRQFEDRVVVRVVDTGCGMSPEVAARAFDPFFTTKGVGKGSGQGLAIAYNAVVEKCGGEIKVDSNPGEGTTFTISLPVAYHEDSLMKVSSVTS